MHTHRLSRREGDARADHHESGELRSRGGSTLDADGERGDGDGRERAEHLVERQLDEHERRVVRANLQAVEEADRHDAAPP